MSNLCFVKCVKKFHEPDLGVGEMACMDRCVLKYMQVVTAVAAKMQSAGENGGGM